MKLTRRNAGTAYGARAYGLDFHIQPAEGKRWKVTIRELTTTVDVVHALGQPVLHIAYEDTLKDIRDILDEFEESNDHPEMRWRLASGIVIHRGIQAIMEELGMTPLRS